MSFFYLLNAESEPEQDTVQSIFVNFMTNTLALEHSKTDWKFTTNKQKETR